MTPQTTKERVFEAIARTPALTRSEWLRRSVLWWLTCLAVLGCIAARAGLEPIRERPLAYVLVLAGGLVAIVGVALWSFWQHTYRRPLEPMSAWGARLRRLLAPAIAAAFVIANAAAPRTLAAPASPFWIHLWCPALLLLSGLGLGALWLRLTRHAPAVEAETSITLLGTLVGALAAFAVTAQCDFADPLHALLTHALPVAVVVALMPRLAQKAAR